MNSYRRPWWLIVNKSAGLITTVQEESGPGERIFIVRGEPLVQGLAWLTWGPVAAVLVVLFLAGLALTFEVKEQAAATRAFFVVAFLGLPALVWGIVTLLFTTLSRKHLQAERQADRQECIIRLNQTEGELFFRSTVSPTERKLAFHDIRRARVTPAVGGQTNQALRLTLDTGDGPVILLNEALGTQAQKSDLAHEIQEALKIYSG